MNTLTSNTRANLQKKNRLSVKNLGVGLAGLDGVNQKVPVPMSTKMLLIAAIKDKGVVKLVTNGKVIEGERIDVKSATNWGSKLDMLQPHLTKNTPAYFVLFRTTTDCLIVTFVPDTAKPQKKMIYASNKESVKDVLVELDDKMELEEYNIAEITDLSFAKYEKKTKAPKPYSEQEILRQEQESAPTGGNYGALARIVAAQNGQAIGTRDMKQGIKGSKPMALPGLSGGINVANLRASLKPIKGVKVKASQMPKGKSKFKSKQSGLDKLEEASILKEFGVNDKEKKAKLEIDLILGVSIINNGKGNDGQTGLTEITELPVPVKQVKVAVKESSNAAPETTAKDTVSKEVNVTEQVMKPKKRGFFAKLFSLFSKKKN